MKWKLSLSPPSSTTRMLFMKILRSPPSSIRCLLSAAMEMEYQVPETWRAEAAVGAGVLTSGCLLPPGARPWACGSHPASPLCRHSWGREADPEGQQPVTGGGPQVQAPCIQTPGEGPDCSPTLEMS